MSEMLLLGAGASIDAGVPGAYAMTQAISKRFRADFSLKKHAHVISFVIGGLLFEAGKNNQDPLSAGVNVEELFNAVQLLAERNTLEAAPFVGSWHAMVEEFDKSYPARSNTRSLGRTIYGLVSKEIRQALSETLSSFEADKIDNALASSIKKTIDAAIKGRSPSLGSNDHVGRAVERYMKETAKKWSDKLRSNSPSGSSDFDRELSQLVDARRPQPGEGRIFHQTNERMIAALKELVWIDKVTAIEYLGPLLNLLKQQKRLVISTLNYDNSIELLANSQGTFYTTGIEHWSTTGDFDFAGEGLFLLKLHGSIDWTWGKNVRSPERLMPHSIICRISHEQMMKGQERPAVIFGQRNKLTAEGPFLDLLRTFRQELSRASELTVVGYSFRDPHINVFISQWLNASRNHTIRIVNGPNAENQPVEYIRDLLRLRGQSPQQVDFIPQYARDGLRTLYGPYDGSFEEIAAGPPEGLTQAETSDTPPPVETPSIPENTGA